jgi:hypothetical protein
MIVVCGSILRPSSSHCRNSGCSTSSWLPMQLTGARPSICLSRSSTGRRNASKPDRIAQIVDGEDHHGLHPLLADPLRRGQPGRIEPHIVGIKTCCTKDFAPS